LRNLAGQRGFADLSRTKEDNAWHMAQAVLNVDLDAASDHFAPEIIRQTLDIRGSKGKWAFDLRV
jgi:hypothetical protein